MKKMKKWTWSIWVLALLSLVVVTPTRAWTVTQTKTKALPIAGEVTFGPTFRATIGESNSSAIMPADGLDPNNCTYTQGFWKNHPEAWPVEDITIGGVTYTKEAAIAIIQTPPRGDATYILAYQLIAAILNTLNGADASDVATTIPAADNWLIDHPLGSDPSGSDRVAGIALAETLDDYNEGLIGPGHCDDQPITPTPDPNNCTYTQGFWKNHPEAWPVEEITIGDVTYPKTDAIATILQTPPRGDATYILAYQLIAAKLNIAKGADDSVVASTITAADDWLIDHRLGSDPSGSVRAVGIALAETLDDYNEGLIGPGHCEGGSAADLSVTNSSSPDPVLAGEDLTYTIEIINNGPSTATGVRLIATLPSGLIFSSTTPSDCTEINGVVTCDLGILAPNDSTTVTIVATVDSTLAGAVTATVEVTANQLDPNPANNMATENTTLEGMYQICLPIILK